VLVLTQLSVWFSERKHPFAAPTRTLVAFGTTFGVVLAFARIAREVVEGETSAFDNDVALAIHGLDNVVMHSWA
jgi:hypothetical protein